ncbi:MAG: hypothetical protein ACPIA3_00960 [Pseudomonadales bacterium]
MQKYMTAISGKIMKGSEPGTGELAQRLPINIKSERQPVKNLGI